MKHMTIEVPRIPAWARRWLRFALTTLLIVLSIAGLIWLIGSIHMNAGSWLGVMGLVLSMSLIAFETNWMG